MPKQGDWNKSFWRKLDKFTNIDVDEVKALFYTTVDPVYNDIYNHTPLKYGGLRDSLYMDVHETEHGASIRIGYRNARHKNNKTGKLDDITNPNLMYYLQGTRQNYNVTIVKVDMQIAISRLRETMKDYWRDRNA